jgi:hypothetical protein
MKTRTMSLETIYNHSVCVNEGVEIRELIGADVEYLDGLQSKWEKSKSDADLDSWIEAEGFWLDICSQHAYAVHYPTGWKGGPINQDCSFSKLHLMDYRTGDIVRQATISEFEGSLDAAEHDQGCGVIVIDGYQYYVQ